VAAILGVPGLLYERVVFLEENRWFGLKRELLDGLKGNM
jgi:hypothetical protein